MFSLTYLCNESERFTASWSKPMKLTTLPGNLGVTIQHNLTRKKLSSAKS